MRKEFGTWASTFLRIDWVRKKKKKKKKGSALPRKTMTCASCHFRIRKSKLGNLGSGIGSDPWALNRNKSLV